jgi:hypothetical protein
VAAFLKAALPCRVILFADLPSADLCGAVQAATPYVRIFGNVLSLASSLRLPSGLPGQD